MTEREALLAAICDKPDEDTPRLIFADWLDENGEPERAEFIRVQIALFHSTEDVRLKRREQELLTKHREAWFVELHHSPALSWGQFERGFVVWLTVYEPTSFLAESDAIFNSTPFTYLDIHDFDDPGSLALIPGMARIRTLYLSLNGHSTESISRFVQSERLDRIEQLHVMSVPLVPKMEALLAARFGSKLIREYPPA